MRLEAPFAELFPPLLAFGQYQAERGRPLNSLGLVTHRWNYSSTLDRCRMTKRSK